MEKDFVNLPSKNEIRKMYESYQGYFNEILNNVLAKLKECVKLASMPNYKARIKSFDSYYSKVLKKFSKVFMESKSMISLTDMIGIRIICPFLEDLGIVENQLKENFVIKEIERKGSEQNFKEFGYESIHVLVDVPEYCMPKNTSLPKPENLVCEIQIRTILQDAWAEVEHELIYKSEFNPFDKPLRRKLASINASLSLADMIFQEIRDYQNKLQSELGFRRNNFYEMADLVASRDEEKKILPSEEKLISPYSKGTIDDLVLEALHAHNSGKLDQAIQIYTKIIHDAPSENKVMHSVIYKHRGMAYFSQGNYESALNDFKKSIELDPSNPRNYYYEGIVYSALGNENKAVESFNSSINISAFHGHVFYRRAISYYNLGDYSKSLQDLESAKLLGLDNEDTQKLRAKLNKKFDMNL